MQLPKEILLFALVFLTRCVPVAIARDKAIKFTAPFVFASALLGSGIGAGMSALVACTLHARLFQRGGRAYAAFIGAQYALAALVARAAFDRMVWAQTHAVHPAAIAGPAAAGFDPFLQGLPQVCAAAIVFVAVNAVLVGLANRGTRYAQAGYARPVLGAQALAYSLSFPFAIALLFSYHAVGVAAVPCLGALLIACAHAVRMTIEVRVLSRQLWAADTLAHSSAFSLRDDDPLERFLGLARHLVAFERAVVWLSEESALVLTPRVAYPAGYMAPSNAEAGPDTLLVRIAARRRPVLIQDVRRDPRCTGFTAAESWVFVPLMLRDRVVGVVRFARNAARPFTATDMHRLAALAPHAAVGYESVQIRRKMLRYEDLATTDGLTGLWNHRRCREVLQIEWSRAERYRRPLSILMMDLDSFKSFNDTYGHPEGDELLRGIARILRRSVRNVDYVGRYGGEEFIVILPETNHADAYILAERIRVAIASHPFILSDGTIVHKTISIGLASYPGDAGTDQALVQHADAALYIAKRSGRNQVVLAATALPPS